MASETLIDLTAEVVANYVANNSVATNDVASVVEHVYGALTRLGQPQEEPTQPKSPVVSIRASVKADHIVCMECGTKHKMIKRHLMTAHHMTPAQYRADYGLPSSYPMVAPNYSEHRSNLAKAIGLGRKPSDRSTGDGGKAAKPGRAKGKSAAA